MTAGSIFAAFLSGLLGAMGVGGGSALIIYLTEILSAEQRTAQGINLIFFISTGVFALIGNIKRDFVDKKLFIKLCLSAIPGAIIGYTVLPFISADILRKIFGILLIASGIKVLTEKSNK